VHQIITGKRKGRTGVGHQIAAALGMKRAIAPDRPLSRDPADGV
jgi:hypothetical protein